MFSDQVYMFAVFGFAALAGGTIIYILVDALLSSGDKSKKRVDAIAQGVKVKKDARDGFVEQTRRKQVQEAISELEEKAKVKKKISLRMRMLQAGLEHVNIRSFYIASIFSGLLFSLILFFIKLPLFVVLLGGIVGGLGLPRFVLNYMTAKRHTLFLKEFVNAIDIIVRGVKAGLPFNDCLQIITTEVGEPVRSEFINLVEQQRIGVPVDQALQKLYERVPLQEVNFFSIVVTIQLQVGGNVSEALANLSKVLRDRAQLKAKVQAVSMEAKSSAAIIGALPLVVMAGNYLINPEYVEILFTHKTGQMIMGACAIVMLLGVLVMRWMINFKI